MPTREPDVLDLLILGILEDEGRVPTTVLAARTGLTERECEERVIGLELHGHIGGYTIIRKFPDPALGPLSACIRIVMAPGRTGDDLYRSMESIAEITTAELLDGDHTVLVRLLVQSRDRLKAITRFFRAQLAVLSLEVSTTQPLFSRRPAPRALAR
ncbi:Lrp/AsnC family transcriptional regulator [Paenarthrobacter sp. CM16]|uniref:Lrp/AsnC family transcriptional regulator n=1 Tax=Paenarthrobacter sp. CM16 TaxID=2738447 RepID=UPI001551AE1A|nr:Lrp/AsnC family transcriptional regulator [Paenarthrobacter sp. CM16]NQD88018.1 Lrp/AsnC family transcriptional regulator [Paenarthrobacter sp. CM16]